MIKLKCTNKSCNYCYSISEKEFTEYKETYHKVCMVCGSRLEVANLEELMKLDIEKRAEEYIHLWFNKLGIEYTCEMIMRHKDEAISRVYIDILKRKGLIK